MTRRDRTVAKTQTYSDRDVDTQESLPSFLIICEGKKTEPNYFKSFRISTLLVSIIGLGDNTLSLVERAKEMKAEYEYDYVWCVFDRDSFPPNQFNAAISLAYSNGMYVAYSNEAFELWYLLHFDFHDNRIERKRYQGLLTSKLGYKYEKNSTKIYEKLKKKQPDAIRNARNLLNQYSHHIPEKDNPSTTVHYLVLCLNILLEYSHSKSQEAKEYLERLDQYHLEVREQCGIKSE